MSKQVEEIIGKEETRELRSEMNDLLSTGEATYDDMEELFLSYGLEMDYLERLLCI